MGVGGIPDGGQVTLINDVAIGEGETPEVLVSAESYQIISGCVVLYASIWNIGE